MEKVTKDCSKKKQSAQINVRFWHSQQIKPSLSENLKRHVHVAFDDRIFTAYFGHFFL